jgi:hypothetical protein
MQPIGSHSMPLYPTPFPGIGGEESSAPPAPITEESREPLKRQNALSAHGIKRKLEHEEVKKYFDGCKRAYLEARLPRGHKV